MIGQYRLKKAVSGIGFYCDISLLVEKDLYSAGVVKIEFEDETIGDQFKIAIQSGIYYFFLRYYRRQRIKSILVRIGTVHLMPTDSTFLVVMFSTIKALYNAFGWDDSSIKINDFGNIELPK